MLARTDVSYALLATRRFSTYTHDLGMYVLVIDDGNRRTVRMQHRHD